jgi:hypothetical protein
VSRFSKEREDLYHGGPVWVVEFDERDQGTLIRRGDGRNIPARGRLWIVPTDGRVVRTELEVEDFVRGGDSRARIHVTWRVEAALGLLVPSEMRELYEGPWQAWNKGRPRQRYDIEGTATYSNYRRFTTDYRIK